MVASLCNPRFSQAAPELSFKATDRAARIVLDGSRFSHADANRVSVWAHTVSNAKRVIIDLANAGEAETSAFAQLVLLRRSLLRAGRDLAISGLRDRAQGLFEVNRLESVLPREN